MAATGVDAPAGRPVLGRKEWTRLPAGPRWPALAQTFQWIVRPYPFLRECARRHGEPFTIRLSGMRPLVMFSAPATIREIFSADPDLLRAGEGNALLRPLLGEGSLLTLDGARHLRHKRILTPPFHGARMKLYGPLLAGITRRIVGEWPSDRPFAVHPQMQEISLEVIVKAVFGVTDEARYRLLRGLLRRMLDHAIKGGALFLPFLQRNLGPLTPWGRFLEAIGRVDAFLYAEISRRRAGGRGDDVLSLLLDSTGDDGVPFTDRELRDELLTMLLAGHETTATALAWAFHWICHTPGVASRLMAEIDALGEGDAAAVVRLPFLDAVSKETLRIKPIVPIVARRLSEPMEIGGVPLPPGAGVSPCIYLTHRRPDLYPDPDRFRPERFLERSFGPYEFLPFGGGTRTCLGASFALFEMKVVLATVLGMVELQEIDGGRVTERRRSVTLAPWGGVKLVARPRRGAGG